jgi:hypothetical protein
MEIKIDEVQVQKALNDQATLSIKTAFEGYQIKSAMEKTITDSVIPEIMTMSICSAVKQIDIEALTQSLAREMAIAVTKGVQAIVTDSMIEIIMRMRKIPDYDEKVRKVERDKIYNSVFKSRG